jgi:hypothetical protein
MPATMFETFLAAAGALVCIALLVHMALPGPQRERVDAAARRIGWRLRSAWQQRRGFKGRARSVPARPAARRPVVGAPPLQRKPPVMTEASRHARPDDGASSEATSAAAGRAVEREAEQEALDIIERARRQSRGLPPVARDGNVLRPDAFKPRPPQDRLH